MDALRLIGESKFIESGHFKDKCDERDLDLDKVKEVIRNKKVLGVLEQNESQNLYKIWYSFEKDKDLNIILRITGNNSIKLVTIFPCKSERRQR